MRIVAVEGAINHDTQQIAYILSKQLGFDFVSLDKSPFYPSSSKGIVVAGKNAFQLFSQASCKIFLHPGDWNQFDEVSTGIVFWAYHMASSEKTVEALTRWVYHHLGEKKLFISVVIPVYNRQSHIVHCLKALFQQTISQEEYEVIVVDDGSQDASGPVAQKKGANVIRITHRGPGAARNAGIQQARGDIIAFIDSDIIVLKDYLEQLRNRHCWSNALLLLGARRHLPDGMNHYKESPLNLDSREKLLRRYSFCLTHLHSPWSVAYTCNFSVTTNFLGEARFDETFVGWGLEDIDLAYRLYQKGAKTIFSKAILGYHLYHDRRLSPARFLIWLQNLSRFLEKYSDPQVKAFSLFKKVFDHAVRADYFVVFDQFESRKPPEKNAEILDLTNIKGDVIETIQKKLHSTPHDLIILGLSDHAQLDAYLPFLSSKRIRAFIPREDWEFVREEFKSDFSKAGCQLIGEETCKK